MSRCQHCGGPLVTLQSIGEAICADCKTSTPIERSKCDSARAKKRSHRLGDKP